MSAYIFRRVLYAIPIVIGVNILTFILFFFVNSPDQIARNHIDRKRATLAEVERWKRDHGYHLPYFYNNGWQQEAAREIKESGWIDLGSIAAGNARITFQLPRGGPHRLTLAVNPPGSVELPAAWAAAPGAPPEKMPAGFGIAGAATYTLEQTGTETLEFEVRDPKGAALRLHAAVPDKAALAIARVYGRHELSFSERLTETLFFQKSVQFLWFDFGYADDGRRISLEVIKRIPPSLSITLPMFLIGLIAEIAFAMMLTYFRGTYLDFWGVVLCVIMMSISMLFYVIAGQWLIGRMLYLAPISGFNQQTPLKFVIMPIALGVISGIGSGARWYRTMFLEEVGKDYIRTARMKGLSEGAVLYKHALKNAMLPILTSVIVSIPFLFMGTLILENFFAIPGMGSFTIEAINRQDFAIVQAMVVLGSYLYILGLVLTDISYTLVDPRGEVEVTAPMAWTAALLPAIKPVFLWTDFAVWMLITGLTLFLFYARTREEYRIAWRQLRVRRLALICGGIVGVFVLIGVLDSFHFQRKEPKGEAWATEVVSVLDVLLQPLKDKEEKTFSAPLAAFAYSKEMIAQPDGSVKFDYPRLRFAGAHLSDPAGALGDALKLAVKGGVLGGLAGGVLAALLFFATGRRAGLGLGGFLVALGFLVGALALVSTLYHALGTDKIGQDVLYRALKGCRTSLIVGTVTTLIVTPFALFFGIAAGYFGGRIDDVIQYVYTTISSIPEILLIAAAMLIVATGLAEEQTIMVADKRLMWLCVILGVTGWTELCRLLRAETLKIREIEYIQAARAFGVSSWSIMLRHVVPNVMHLVLISVMLRFSSLVLFEAVLAYVGIGVDPTTESWGNLVNTARQEIVRDPVVWWGLLASFLFMFGLVLPANIFGDALRDALDPRLRDQ